MPILRLYGKEKVRNIHVSVRMESLLIQPPSRCDFEPVSQSPQASVLLICKIRITTPMKHMAMRFQTCM